MSDTPQFERSMQAAITAARLGKLGDARDILERVAQSSPVNDGFFALYLDVLEGQRDWQALEGAARSWQQHQPNQPRVFDAQAKAAWESGRLHEALGLYRKVMALTGTDATRLASFARLCLNALEFDAAEKALGESEALDANNAHMLSAKAGLLTFRGRFDEAETYCRRALASDPADVSAYRLLTQIKRGHLALEERQSLAALSQRSDLRLEHRITAAFTLGDALDAEGAIDRAFAAYQLAQSLALERGSAEALQYKPDLTARDVDYLIELFGSVPPAQPNTNFPRPIFIVGMPRSGTTLVENVLAAHSRVLACGERMVMRQIKREYLWLAGQSRDASAEIRANFVRAYFDQLPQLAGADHITDKNPWNFDAVGLILALLPHAHIVHVRRNPVETGLSIYRHEFPKFQAFTQRLEHVGHYYGQYARLMAHWERLAGARLTTIQYEDFVADFDTAAPALVRACGLEWEEACRSFQSNERVIATLSAVQAREPVFDRSGRAERYAGHLGPLIEALTKAGVDLTSGALRTGA
jgi:tetratricopeptide (TPR) repeat protein